MKSGRYLPKLGKYPRKEEGMASRTKPCLQAMICCRTGVSPESPGCCSPAGRRMRRKRRRRRRRRRKKISEDFLAMQWEVWGGPSARGCPQTAKVPLALPPSCATLTPQLQTSAQSQAAPCSSSRKLIFAPAKCGCGRAPACTGWAGTELLIRSPG